MNGDTKDISESSIGDEVKILAQRAPFYVIVTPLYGEWIRIFHSSQLYTINALERYGLWRVIKSTPVKFDLKGPIIWNLQLQSKEQGINLRLEVKLATF